MAQRALPRDAAVYRLTYPSRTLYIAQYIPLANVVFLQNSL